MASEHDDTATCPTCKQAIPIDRFELHLAGLDGAHPECPKTDLVEIVERERAGDRERALWACFHPWTHVWSR